MPEVLLAALPIVYLSLVLTIFRVKGWKAALQSLALALVIALFLCREPLPRPRALAAIANGAVCGLCPIGLVIVSALFAYRICKASGSLLVIKSVLASLSSDTRILVLIVAWGFGNFIEGVAGFGTAVAIPAAILVGVGLNPVRTIVVCLIANASSTMYGSVGVGVLALAHTTGLPAGELGVSGIGIAAPIFLLTPCLMVASLTGIRSLKGVTGLCLAAGLAFVLAAAAVSVALGPELANICGSLVSLSILIALSRFVKTDPAYAFVIEGRIVRRFSAYHVFRAASPFLFVTVFLIAYAFLAASAKAYLPSGLVILVAGVLGGWIQGLRLRQQLVALVRVVRANAQALVTICAVLALARLMDEAGLMQVLAQALTSCTGRAYVFLAPVVGALGGFITGSGTGSNVLFGGLQAGSAAVLGFKGSVFAGANMLGAGIGKMVCPQSIVIGLSAVGLANGESRVLRAVAGWFVLLLTAACALCGFVAFVG